MNVALRPIREATEDDASAILAMAAVRDPRRWNAAGSYFAVHDGPDGIVAFIALRPVWERGELWAERLEGERVDGEPTVRGMRAMQALGAWAEDRARERGLHTIVCPVGADNARHEAALRAFGYADAVHLFTKRLEGG